VVVHTSSDCIRGWKGSVRQFFVVMALEMLVPHVFIEQLLPILSNRDIACLAKASTTCRDYMEEVAPSAFELLKEKINLDAYVGQLKSFLRRRRMILL